MQESELKTELNDIQNDYLHLKMKTDQEITTLKQQVKELQRVRMGERRGGEGRGGDGRGGEGRGKKRSYNNTFVQVISCHYNNRVWLMKKSKVTY